MTCQLFLPISAAAKESHQERENRFRKEVIRSTEAAPTSADSQESTLAAAALSPAERFENFDSEFAPPPGAETFELSQDYPASYDPNEYFPWMEIDFRSNPASYLQAVLTYCLEGNIEIEFQGQNNAVRKWYHAPWMHDDSEDKQSGRRQGREFHHGLTRERRSRAHELHPNQTADRIQNWAVSLYNARGGYTLGKVWLTPDGFPDPSRGTFPDNAVSFKLLFTAADKSQVPFLKDGFHWTANINPAVPPTEGAPFERVDQELTMLQVDVAVKDPRVADASGWIFGTFVYDSSQSKPTPWERLVPVGLSWGDDDSEQRFIDREGSSLNPFLKESVPNASLVEPPAGVDWGHRAYLRHFGLGQRLNGPVDNPYSSCISCHGRAGTYADALPLNERSGLPMPILAGAGSTLGSKSAQVAEFTKFFRTIRPNSHLEQANDPAEGSLTFVTVDYSLQISQGIRNYYQHLRSSPAMLAGLRAAQGSETEILELAPALKRLPHVSRDEDE